MVKNFNAVICKIYNAWCGNNMLNETLYIHGLEGIRIELRVWIIEKYEWKQKQPPVKRLY